MVQGVAKLDGQPDRLWSAKPSRGSRGWRTPSSYSASMDRVKAAPPPSEYTATGGPGRPGCHRATARSPSSASVPRTPPTRSRARPADGESGSSSLRATSSCGNRSSSASGLRLARRSSSRFLCCVSSASNAATAGCEPALSKIRIEQASSPCSRSVFAHHVLTRAVFPIPIGPVMETTRTVPSSHRSSSQLSSASRPNRSTAALLTRGLGEGAGGGAPRTSRSQAPGGGGEDGAIGSER